MARILLIDDDLDFSPDLAQSLADHGHEVRWLDGAEEGLDLLVRHPDGFDVVLLDQCLPRMHGLEFLGELRRREIAVPVLLFTGQGTADVAIRASKLGAFRYLPKPRDLEPESLVSLLQLTSEAANLARCPSPLPADAAGPLIGQSEAMRAVYERIGLADDNRPVLILGEVGTGKESIARTVHRYGPHGDWPLPRVNCLAFTEERLDDELFGHEAGAYPGVGPRPGAFELADGGAVLLDHFHLLSLSAQARVARVIRENVVQRGGRGAGPRRARVRVLACSSEDVRAALAAGRLDSELYYLLERTTIHLPPLRDRGDDVLLLADHFLRQAAAALRRPVRSLSRPARDRLMRYGWPGNVRELEGVIRRAVMACRGAEIGPEDLAIGPAEPGDAEPGLPPSRERAYQLFLWAVKLEPDLAGRTDAEVFRWLRRDPRVERDDLPASCETFRRYLREARAHHGSQKNTPRSGRPHGRSVVRACEV